jgi:hypothetical protein
VPGTDSCVPQVSWMRGGVAGTTLLAHDVDVFLCGR